MIERVGPRGLGTVLFGVAAVVGIVLLIFLSRPAGATIGPFEWTVHDRVDATSFVPAEAPVGLPGPGYEIVSFDAALPSAGLSPYVYGGLDLPASLGGPLSESLVACSVDFEAGALKMSVVGAFPYSGCVFFLGVRAPADETQVFDLTLLPNVFEVMCDTPGCGPEDVELLFGGTTPEEVETLCLPLNDPEQFERDGNLYTIAGSDIMICPMFVTVAQSSNEATLYEVWVVPPDDNVIGPDDDTDAIVADVTPVVSSVGTGLATPTDSAPSRLLTWLFVLLLMSGVSLFGISALRRPVRGGSTAPPQRLKPQRSTTKDDPVE